MFQPRHVQRHINTLIPLERQIGTSFGLTSQVIFHDSNSGNSTTVLENEFQLFFGSFVVDILNEDRSCVFPPPLLKFLGLLVALGTD